MSDPNSLLPNKRALVKFTLIPAAPTVARDDVQGDEIYPTDPGKGGIVDVVPGDTGDISKFAYRVFSDSITDGPTSVQRGTCTLGANGVSAKQVATITATSRILMSYKDPPAPAADTLGFLVAKNADRTVGLSTGAGGFIIRTFTSAGVVAAGFVGATVDWEVVN
jgi:hypothetical protein